MAGLNRVVLCGRLGRDPEEKSFANGGKLVTFSIATSESWTKDGERQEKTEWHDISVANEKQGEIAMRFLKKGSEVLIEGTLRSREYEKDGVKRKVWEVQVPKFGGSLTLIGGKAAGGDSRGSSEPQQQRTPAPAAAGNDDWDIPF
jgi:single-strand DNA-binding protein